MLSKIVLSIEQYNIIHKKIKANMQNKSKINEA